jgi:hypothetical protein
LRDLPADSLSVRLDEAAPPGDVLRPLASLLLQIARRRANHEPAAAGPAPDAPRPQVGAEANGLTVET